jgi:hypothetical protein
VIARVRSCRSSEGQLCVSRDKGELDRL